MDSESVATIVQTATGAAGAIRGIVDAIGAAREQIKGNKKAEEPLSEALDLAIELRTRILDLQEKAFGLNQELTHLQAENVQLREDISRKEGWTAERQKYQRKKMGNATVMISDQEPDTFFCPSCCEEKHLLIPLQPLPHKYVDGLFSGHKCTLCQALFYTGVYDNQGQPVA